MNKSFVLFFSILIIAGCQQPAWLTKESPKPIPKSWVLQTEKSGRENEKFVGYVDDKGQKQGKWAWSRNDYKFSECVYVNGKRNGKVTEWYYSSNNKRRAGKYVDDKLHGKFTEWYKEGQKKGVGKFKHGIEHGRYIEWYKSGRIKRKVRYKDSAKVDWAVRTFRGRGKSRIHGRSKGWYENGQKRWDEGWKDGHYEGKSTRWYSNGNKKEEFEFKDRQVRGRWIKWDENGKKTKEEFYNNNGELIRTIEYKNGQPVE